MSQVEDKRTYAAMSVRQRELVLRAAAASQLHAMVHAGNVATATAFAIGQGVPVLPLDAEA